MCHWLEISNTILSGWCSGLSGFEVSTRFTSPLYLAPVEPTSRSRISSTHHRTSFPKRHEQPQAPCLDDNHGMKFDNTWNQGVWFALRSATGRPSPQPFSVEDLPALGEEYRRIMKIISAVYTSKKTLSKKVVRKRGVIKPLLNEIRFKLLELQQKENDGLLMLDKLSKHGINGLIRRQ